MRVVWSGRVDVGALVRALRGRGLNYDPAEVRRPAWTFDVHRHGLGREAVGPPVEGGLWWRAKDLVAGYEFSPPEIVRAFHEPGTDLLGRDMLLQARLPGLRFLMGVRVTDVRNEVSDERTAWGWGYETLEGHLERGRVDYELVKHHATGEVEFVARSYSQLHPRAPWWMRWGWRLFGRRVQLRFYRRAGQRLRRLAADPVVAVPTVLERPTGRGVSVPDPLS
ncbi:DUF1990 family protein [Saccharothrix sp. NPDC042600]|uniref:DUF1990 family protein n=1 Tax=Saccharothrix TaxID=2071 RepID=UPI0033E52D06|nr:hypothetical protein GCM10017745_74830 [Saccharothrix mutabilis subsp. capreolus]